MYDFGVVRKVCAFLALPETDKKPSICMSTVSGATDQPSHGLL